MELYFEMLKEYNETKKVIDTKIKEQKEVLKKLKEASRKNEERIREYVGKNLIFGEYEIESYFDQERKVQMYYPVLHMDSTIVGGITNVLFKCTDSYAEEEETTEEIIQQYELKSGEGNINITITAISNAYTLGYSDHDVLLEIKDNFVMDNKVKYKVIINGKEEYAYERDFGGKIINKILKERLKDKYISYSNFDKESQRMRSKRLRETGRRGRMCKNMLLTIRPNWQENIYIFIYNNIVRNLNPEFDAEKVIADITKNYKKCSKEGKITRIYQISGDEILFIILNETDEYNNCYAYEDEELILEIPYPDKRFRIDVYICTYQQIEDIENYTETYHDTFYIVEKADIDLNKKLNILDILKELKTK